ncbi:MAG: hypothetical protein ACR2LI_05460, partial [Propionibacteriaceae bacterium]
MGSRRARFVLAAGVLLVVGGVAIGLASGFFVGLFGSRKGSSTPTPGPGVAANTTPGTARPRQGTPAPTPKKMLPP